MSLLRNHFFKWTSASLLGHLVLFWLLCGGPLVIIFAYLSYIDGNLSAERVMRIIAVSTAFAFSMALLLWLAVTRRLNKRHKKLETRIGQ
jgi:hypothetical protein